MPGTLPKQGGSGYKAKKLPAKVAKRWKFKAEEEQKEEERWSKVPVSTTRVDALKKGT